MRLMFARALTVALAVLGGAAAMAFPKLVIDEAVPEASPPVIADRAPSAVTVIRIAPAEAVSAPAPAGAAPDRAEAPSYRLHTYLQLGDRLGAPARADGTLPADSPGHLAAADEASPCPADADTYAPTPALADPDAHPHAGADPRSHPCPARGAGCRRSRTHARHGRRAAGRPAAGRPTAGRRAADGEEGAAETRQVAPVRLVRRLGADRPCRLRGCPARRGRR